MKRFRFRLEAVRSQRQQIENLRIREWSIVNRMMNQLIQDRTDLEARLQSAMAEMTEAKQARVVSTSIISEIENFIQGIKLRIEWKKSEITRAEKFVDRKRMEWMDARKRRKTIDVLREKKLEEFKSDQRSKELKTVDEIYIMQGSRKEE